jgi:hypothetical protein
MTSIIFTNDFKIIAALTNTITPLLPSAGANSVAMARAVTLSLSTGSCLVPKYLEAGP